MGPAGIKKTFLAIAALPDFFADSGAVGAPAKQQ